MAKEKKTLEELLEEALVPENEVPYKVPENWVWSYTKCINEVITGNTPSKKQSEYYGDYLPFVKPNDLEQGRYLTSSIEYLSKEGSEKARIIPSGSTTVCCIGSIGKVAYTNVECSTNQQINTLIPNKKLDGLYTYYYVLTPEFQALLNQNSSATTISIINKTKVSNLYYPIPPMSEQKRIVEKIESLFSKLDKSKELIEEAREGFKNRKTAILSKTFRGDLTKKWREENAYVESAEALLKKIEEERGKSNTKKKKTDVIENIDIPYELPKKWKWVELNDVCYNIGDVDHKMPKAVEKGFPYISPRDFKGKNEINFKDSKKILLEDFNKLSKKIKPEKYDIIFARYGTVGITRFIETSIDFLASYSCAIIKTDKVNMLPKYIFYYTKSQLCMEEVKKYINQTTQANVGIKSIKQFLFPLPPIEEQKQIVKILDKLIEEESKIEELTQLKDQIEIIKKSILAKAFRGELGTNDPSEESALELLKDVLKENYSLKSIQNLRTKLTK